MHFVPEKVVPLPSHVVSERLYFFMKENYLLSTEGPKSTVFLYVLSNVAYNDACTFSMLKRSRSMSDFWHPIVSWLFVFHVVVAAANSSETVHIETTTDPRRISREYILH